MVHCDLIPHALRGSEALWRYSPPEATNLLQNKLNEFGKIILFLAVPYFSIIWTSEYFRMTGTGVSYTHLPNESQGNSYKFSWTEASHGLNDWTNLVGTCDNGN